MNKRTTHKETFAKLYGIDMKVKDNRSWSLKEKYALYRVHDTKEEMVCVGTRSGKTYIAACMAVAHFLRSIKND